MNWGTSKVVTSAIEANRSFNDSLPFSYQLSGSSMAQTTGYHGGEARSYLESLDPKVQLRPPIVRSSAVIGHMETGCSRDLKYIASRHESD